MNRLIRLRWQASTRYEQFIDAFYRRTDPLGPFHVLLALIAVALVAVIDITFNLRWDR
ncbi:hypothetical protein EDD29_0107 [Actinocorallia herbida]|uniref:Uncharacterized protein n=1 Tax=Actinocorallia herbida TaxID=58109 RepID=A0A3N1CMS4_9ACTN|nr:hypothetical protein [Actinocorallia herbida]ROO82626.1 hypothetical protein EDD29_0107 [Actinocorallia herbida]